MLIALPGAAGLFSVLQEAFRHEELDRPRLRLSKTLHGFLHDFRALAEDVMQRPTRIAELVPDVFPSTLGACDAAGSGMGGVHFIPSEDKKIIPILWRQRFPTWITNRLVSFANPKGDINNSELELAGSVAQHDILANVADVTERTVHNSYDNTAAMYWQRKQATTTVGPAAYLLRLQSLHQRAHRYVPLHDYIPGPANIMADTLSRRWDLSDTALLAHFNSTFPQDVPWKLCRLTPTMNSNLISALSRRRCERASVTTTPKRKIVIGQCGMISACNTTLTHSSITPPIPSHISKFSATNTDAANFPLAVKPSHLAQWRTPYVRSVRRTPGWGPRTPAKTPPAASTTGYTRNSEGTENRTSRQAV
jgi:hypothetical protein